MSGGNSVVFDTGDDNNGGNEIVVEAGKLSAEAEFSASGDGGMSRLLIGSRRGGVADSEGDARPGSNPGC